MVRLIREAMLDPQALGGHTTKAMTLRYLRQRETVVAEPPRFGQRPRALDKSA